MEFELFLKYALTLLMQLEKVIDCCKFNNICHCLG